MTEVAVVRSQKFRRPKANASNQFLFNKFLWVGHQNAYPPNLTQKIGIYNDSNQHLNTEKLITDIRPSLSNEQVEFTNRKHIW